MEIVENKLKELAQRRRVLERKSALRLATLDEFSAVREESCKKILLSIKEENLIVARRNEQILKDISSAVIKAQNAQSVHSGKKSKFAQLLEEEKSQYTRAVDNLRSSWSAQVLQHQEQNFQKLQRERESVEKRRKEWREEFVREDQLRSQFEKERKELMIQLAFEQKDKIAADIAEQKYKDGRKQLDSLLTKDLVDYQVTTKNSVSAQVNIEHAPVSSEYKQSIQTELPTLPELKDLYHENVREILNDVVTMNKLVIPQPSVALSNQTPHVNVKSSRVAEPLQQPSVSEEPPRHAKKVLVGDSSVVKQSVPEVEIEAVSAVQVQEPPESPPKLRKIKSNNTIVSSPSAGEIDGNLLLSRGNEGNPALPAPGSLTPNSPETPRINIQAVTVDEPPALSNVVKPINNKSPSNLSLSRGGSVVLDTPGDDSEEKSLARSDQLEPVDLKVEYLGLTEEWKLFKSVLALKLLCSRLESAALSSGSKLGGTSNNSSFSSTTDTNDAKKAYVRAVSRPHSKDTTEFNTTVACGWLGKNVRLNLSSVVRILKSAYENRERELLIYGNDLIAMAVLIIVQEKSLEIFPSELFNGIVTLEKIVKQLKKDNPAGFELFSVITQHLNQLVMMKLFPVDDVIGLYCEVMISCMAEEDKTRLRRKVSLVLKEAALGEMSTIDDKGAGRTGYSDKTWDGTGTFTTVSSMTTTKSVAKSPEKKNTSFLLTKNSTHTIDTSIYGDDEFVEDDQPVLKIPPLKDLSEFMDASQQKNINLNGVEKGKGGTAVVEDDDFDFL